MFSINRIKKITQLITVTFTALALILSFFPFHQPAFAAQTTELEVIIKQQPGSATATAQVYLHHPKGMAAGELEATYDANLFTVQEVSKGTLLEQNNFDFLHNKSEAGTIRAVWLNYREGINESGIIFEATFSASNNQPLELLLKNISLKKINGASIRLGAAVIKLQIGNKEAWVNDVATTLDAAPFIHGSRTMVPVRFVSEQLDAKVTWLPNTRQVRIEDGSKTILLTIDSTKTLVDGRDEPLDVPAMIVNSRTFVPLRFVSETLGAKVTWHDSTRSITIE